jgi:cell fate regulator YaaT (PSP1 superfamily)
VGEASPGAALREKGVHFRRKDAFRLRAEVGQDRGRLFRRSLISFLKGVAMGEQEDQPTNEQKGMREPQTYIVRFGAMRHLGLFHWHRPRVLAWGTQVVVQTERGREAGMTLREATPEVLSHLRSGGSLPRGTILRVMTEADRAELARIAQQEKEDFRVCKRHVKQLGLPMKLVRVERLLAGERLVVYFVAERRVDFRELVRTLARHFRTRIEMRQIGVRDEARLLAEYGDCGLPVCCKTHLTAIPPITMQMAKLQRSSLDPSKISGCCGRLKCCLRYEYDTYEEILRRSPPLGARVACREGVGVVVNYELLRERVWVELEEKGIRLVPITELQVISVPAEPAALRNAAESSETQAGLGLQEAEVNTVVGLEEPIPQEESEFPRSGGPQQPDLGLQNGGYPEGNE